MEDTFPCVMWKYSLYDKHSKLLAFSELPLQWDETSSFGDGARHIFLCGDVRDGSVLRKSYHQVKAWRYSISGENPEIWVLLEEDDLPLEKEKEDHWVKLEDPCETYAKFSRSILVSVHCLWFFKRKPEESIESFLDHLWIVFSSYDVMPSLDDLIENLNFIREATSRDETLANCKFLSSFLVNPKKSYSPDLLREVLREQQRGTRQLPRHHKEITVTTLRSPPRLSF